MVVVMVYVEQRDTLQTTQTRDTHIYPKVVEDHSTIWSIFHTHIQNMLKQISWSSKVLLLLLNLSCIAQGNGQQTTKQKGQTNYPIPAAFVFGDSTVDPGNNNYIDTIFRSNFPPYGLDFPHQTPTGRFTDGRLTTDFIASYAGIKQSIPPYLDPNLTVKDLITGVSFASAGSGYDPETAQRIGVLDLGKQMEYFKEYKKRLYKMIGRKRTDYIINNGVAIVSAGTNDIVDVFGVIPPVLQTQTPATYLPSLLNKFKWFMQALQDEGVRRIGVVSIPPAGCLPVAMTLHLSLIPPRSCVDSLNSIAMDFNKMLQNEIKSIQRSKPNIMVAYVDIYNPLFDQINNPHKYGFEVVDKGCCGTGLIEGAYTCNALTPVCDDPSKYVFWDVIHPTQRSYYFLFQSVRPAVDYFLHNSP